MQDGKPTLKPWMPQSFKSKSCSKSLWFYNLMQHISSFHDQAQYIIWSSFYFSTDGNCCWTAEVSIRQLVPKTVTKRKEFFGLQVVIISLSQNKRRHLQVVNIYELKPLWRRELQPESETKHQGNFSVSCSKQRIFGRKNWKGTETIISNLL